MLDTLTGKPWRSALVAGLFSLHPLHVETVAWISERKSLLCTVFWLLATLGYVRYARRGGAENYLLVLLLYVGALLSKPVAVSLPFTLLLLDFWPLGRYRPPQRGSPKASGAVTAPARPGQGFGPLLVEKLPLFVLSGLACWITVAAQTDLGATKSLAEVPMGARLSNSVVACALYLRRLVWPVDLAPIYPLRHDWLWWQVAGCGLLLLSISLWAVAQAARRPYLLVGWCWYLATLFPTLGLVQVGSQAMADRYAYLPLIGVFLLLVWDVSERIGGMRRARVVLGIGAGAAVAACAISTLATVRYWRGSIPLFEHAIRVTDGNYIAYRQLGMAFLDGGNPIEAEKCYRESLGIEPNDVLTELCLAEALLVQGDSPDALEHCSLALKLKPASALAHGQLAELLIRSTDARFHDPSRAIEEARLACGLSHYRNRRLVTVLAQAYAENGQVREAAGAAQKALALSVGPEEVQGAAELAANIRLTGAADNEQFPPRRPEIR
jgi:cytochrome c-type biogenesis protein CcmH/NrfG